MYRCPEIYDDNDFIGKDAPKHKKVHNISTSIYRFVQNIFYSYFPYLIIMYLVYSSAMLNGRSVSDILSSIYLYFALKYIINNKQLFSKNTKYISSLRTYNWMVMTFILIYQSPFFICPSAVDINGYTDPDYINTEDCSLIMHH